MTLPNPDTSTTSAPTPPRSMYLTLGVGTCYGALRKSVGNYSQNYSVVGIQNVYLELSAGDGYVGGAISTFSMSCKAPVEFRALRANGLETVIDVTSLLVIDEPFSRFSLTNKGTIVAPVWINYATTAINSTAGTVATVNGQFPDSIGNVEVDVGVKTIDSQAPDSAGDIILPTDEGTF